MGGVFAHKNAIYSQCQKINKEQLRDSISKNRFFLFLGWWVAFLLRDEEFEE